MKKNPRNESVTQRNVTNAKAASSSVHQHLVAAVHAHHGHSHGHGLHHHHPMLNNSNGGIGGNGTDVNAAIAAMPPSFQGDLNKIDIGLNSEDAEVQLEGAKKLRVLLSSERDLLIRQVSKNNTSFFFNYSPIGIYVYRC
jgi:hypothetical protein